MTTTLKNQLTITSGLAESPAETVSTKYVYISTKEIVAKLIEKGWEVKKQGQANARKTIGFQKHIIILENPSIVTSEGIPQIVVRNSHNASSACELYFGFMRIKCANQLFAKSLGDGMSVKIYHRASSVQLIDDKINEFLGSIPAFLQSIEKAQSIQLDRKTALAFAREAMAIRYSANLAQKINAERLLDVRRIWDQEDNLWVIFNRIQESIIRGGIEYTSQKANGGQTAKSTKALRSETNITKYNVKLGELMNKYLTTYQN